MSLIELTDITKTYDLGEMQVPVLKGVSLSVGRGELVALMGASGSGKSTLAKMITATERPTSGAVTFGDTTVSSLRGRGRRALYGDVQMIFQDPYGALNPLHTVGYVLQRPLHNHLHLDAAASRRRVAELLELVGLTPTDQFVEKLPHQLSGGQRQRVVIARALASEPKLIVADEPVSMLDVSLRAGVLELLARLRRERGLSLLYITHDLLSARVVTDEILVLNKGVVVERGVTKQVLQHPSDPYTTALLDAIATPGSEHSSVVEPAEV